VVLFDADGRELDRAPTPSRPSALAAADGVVVVGGAEPRIARYAIERGAAGPRLVARGEVSDPALGGVRALATAGGTLYGADDEGDAIVAWRPDGAASSRWTARCGGPFALARTAAHLVAACLLDHAVLSWRLGPGGLPEGEPVAIRHDGPVWSIAALEDGGALWLALGGVEDHPLDRSDGTFGNVDSFAFLYRLDGARAERRAAVNLGELGAVTPKWVDLRRADDGGLAVRAIGYGGDRLVELTWPADGRGAPRATTREVPPGIAALAPGEGGPGLAADPLLDAWVVLGEEVVVRPAPAAPGAPARSLDSRIGELLAFTRTMAPWAPTEGKASRFTCETCHFEGGVDGRVHFTGRGAVHATTKPLAGLFGNRPHFTRALDPTMAGMVDNEFEVATRSSGRDPWFSLDAASAPWLRWVDGAPATLDATALRRALMAFLIDFAPEPNRRARGRVALSPDEARGAAIFRDRCVACHPARRVADRPDSEVPFARWPDDIFGRGAITWARDGYETTGVTPYVHERGARPSSLRRLARKRPYFTNGSAATLDEVLARCGWRGERFFHDGAPADAERLGDDQRRVLRGFLDLL
jgi:hypothetical protein